jgi:hypothetical protein
LRYALFWDITKRWVVILYQRFGTTYRSHLQGSRIPGRKLSSWNSWPLIPPSWCRWDCALLGYYASLSGSSASTFRDNLSVPSLRVIKLKKKAFFPDFLTLEDWTDRPSRNVGTELPLNDA